MHYAAAAAGHPLNSSGASSAQSWSLLHYWPHGRRTAHRPDPAGTKTVRDPASRKDSYMYLNNESPRLSRLAPGDQARGVLPQPQSTRLLAQAGRAPPPAQRRLGTRRSPSQGTEGEVATRHWRPSPGQQRHARCQPDSSLRLATPLPRRNLATATRTTPVAQLERGRNSPPAAQPRAAASQPRSTRPPALAGRAPPQRNGDSKHIDLPVREGSYQPTAAQPTRAILTLGLASLRPSGTVSLNS
jgi:hypothetical protein